MDLKEYDIIKIPGRGYFTIYENGDAERVTRHYNKLLKTWDYHGTGKYRYDHGTSTLHKLACGEIIKKDDLSGMRYELIERFS